MEQLGGEKQRIKIGWMARSTSLASHIYEKHALNNVRLARIRGALLLNCLYEFAMAENSTRLLRYTGSLKPG